MKKLIVSALAFGPVLALAQTQPNLGYVTSLMTTLKTLVNSALPLVVGLALLGFFWGLAKFIFSGGEDKEKGKTMMIWGVVALFVMTMVWGLVRFLGDVSGVSNLNQNSVTVPSVNGLNNQ